MARNDKLIARGARWTRWAVIGILVATIIFQLAVLVPGVTHVRLHQFGGGPVGPVLNVAHSLFMLLALGQLILVLRQIESGELFSAKVTRRIRQFALFSMLAVVIGTFVAPLIAFLDPGCPTATPCPRRFPIDMRGLWAMVSSLVFFLVARLLDEARRIDDDNRQII